MPDSQPSSELVLELPNDPEEEESSVIYIVDFPPIPAIKVGITSELKKRLSGLQTANALKLRLIATLVQLQSQASQRTPPIHRRR